MHATETLLAPRREPLGLASQRLSDTQKGAIIENLVANWVMIGSGGQLSPYQPVADDRGVDLLVYDRDTSRVLLVQVKGRTRTQKMTAGRRTVQFSVRTQTFEARPDFYVLGVLVDESLHEPEAFWLVPSEVVRTEAGRASRGTLRIVASPSPSSADRWSRYRSISVAGLIAMMAGQ